MCIRDSHKYYEQKFGKLPEPEPTGTSQPAAETAPKTDVYHVDFGAPQQSNKSQILAETQRQLSPSTSASQPTPAASPSQPVPTNESSVCPEVATVQPMD